MKGLVLCLVLAASLAQVAQAAAVPAPERQRQLIRMVRQDCGSCHGMTLKGGLGSPLLPQNLRDKPPTSLVATILYGRAGTAMPPWQSKLDDAEAAWIVEQLLNGFPNE